MTDELQPEQAAYERRMADMCSMLMLLALVIDTDPESRALSPTERIKLANDYARDWAEGRGYARGPG